MNYNLYKTILRAGILFFIILIVFTFSACSDCIKCSDCEIANVKITNSKYEGKFCPEDFPNEKVYKAFKKAASKVCECK